MVGQRGMRSNRRKASGSSSSSRKQQAASSKQQQQQQHAATRSLLARSQLARSQMAARSRLERSQQAARSRLARSLLARSQPGRNQLVARSRLERSQLTARSRLARSRLTRSQLTRSQLVARSRLARSRILANSRLVRPRRGLAASNKARRWFGGNVHCFVVSTATAVGCAKAGCGKASCRWALGPAPTHMRCMCACVAWHTHHHAMCLQVLGHECQHGCMDTFSSHECFEARISCMVSFILRVRDEFFKLKLHSQEAGTQYVLEELRNSWDADSRFKKRKNDKYGPFQMWFGRPWEQRPIGMICAGCWAKLMGITPWALEKAVDLRKEGKQQVKIQSAVQSNLRDSLGGVSYTPVELNVHSWVEDQFLPVYAECMPTHGNIRELHPLNRGQIFAWYLEWTVAAKCDKGVVAAEAQFRRVWNSNWFQDVYMRKSKTVGKSCWGHDCGNPKCPQRLGCTKELIAMKNKTTNQHERKAVEQLEVAHFDFHGKDKMAYHINQKMGAEAGVVAMTCHLPPVTCDL